MAVSSGQFLFEVNGFNFKSSTFLILFIMVILFSGFGILFLFALPMILICTNIIFPGLYHSFTKFIIKSSNNRIVRVLSFIPKVDFNGNWYQTLEPQKVVLRTKGDILQFLKNNLLEISTIHLIFFVLALRFVGSFGLNVEGDLVGVNAIYFGLITGRMIVALIILPLFLGFYFVIVWTIRDAGLKLFRYSETTKGENKEFEEIFQLSDSIKSLYGFLFGIPSIFWLISYANTNSIVFLDFLPEWLNASIFVVLLYLLTIGITIFTLVFYYRGENYQLKVNELREWIRYSSKGSPTGIESNTFYQYSNPKQQGQQDPNVHQEMNQKLPQQTENIPETNFQHNQTKTSPKFCTGCGSKLKIGQKFCVSCGKQI